MYVTKIWGVDAFKRRRKYHRYNSIDADVSEFGTLKKCDVSAMGLCMSLADFSDSSGSIPQFKLPTVP